MSINSEIIGDIEEFLNENMQQLENTSYKNITKFKLKPGHKSILLGLPDEIKKLRESQHEDNLLDKIKNFPEMLKIFLQTAQSNFGRPPNGLRYCEVNRNFSTLVYMLCGRACYDTLSANLPMPTSHTIRKIFFQMRWWSALFN